MLLPSWPDLAGSFRGLQHDAECGLGALVGVTFLPSAQPDVEDVVAFHFDCFARFFNDGGGGFGSAPQSNRWNQSDNINHGGDAFEVSSFDRMDFDADGKEDLVGAHVWVTAFSQTALAGAMPGVRIDAPVAQPWVAPCSKQPPDAPITSIATGQFDADSKPDLVYLEPWDDPANGCVPRATSYDNLVFDGKLLHRTDDFVHQFVDLSPRFLLHGRFRGGAYEEILAVAADGKTECLQLDRGTLVRCP
jgi:hypothetical protein